jgi:hypothetical protein
MCLYQISKKGKLCLFDVNHSQGPIANRAPISESFAVLPLRRTTPNLSAQPRTGAMNRIELLRLLLNQAQFNGFEFRGWFQTNVRQIWPGTEPAIALLAEEGRHFTLLFSHDFASCFWRPGGQMSFMVPSTSYSRVNSRGGVVQVTRKQFTRRTIKPDVWKYHLRQMAVADNPIEYLCRFLPIADQLTLQPLQAGPAAAQATGRLAFMGRPQAV